MSRATDMAIHVITVIITARMELKKRRLGYINPAKMTWQELSAKRTLNTLRASDLKKS